MKKLTYCILLLLGITSCSPKTNYLKTDQTLPLNKTITIGENPHLIGVSNRQGLQKAPFQEWYNKYYNEYKPKKEVIKKAKSKTKGVEILAFMGTWCGDSKRGVPQFYKVLDELGFDEENLKLVNVDNSDEAYKQSPNGEEKGLNIHRVPTFIFYKEGKEIGRIVESPTTSFEIDITQILLGLPTKAKYEVVATLENRLKEKGLEAIESKLEPWRRFTRRYARSASELNTYGYVLFSAGKKQEALTIFKINTLAFPNNANAFDSLGEAYKRTGQKELAIENYKKVLEMEPENEHVKEVLKELENS